MLPHPLEVLRTEHREMSRYLDLLERQIELVEERREPDTELLMEITDYFRSYPDLYHHPKEDLILRRMAARDPAAAEPFQRLDDEHEMGGRQLVRMSRALVAMLLDAETGRTAFIRAAREFLEGERRHIAWEDSSFFDAAEAVLESSDWAHIESCITRLDPCNADTATLQRHRLMSRRLTSWRVGSA